MVNITVLTTATFPGADIDIWNFRTPAGARVDRARDGAIFSEALRGAALLAICFAVAVWTLFRSVDEVSVTTEFAVHPATAVRDGCCGGV